MVEANRAAALPGRDRSFELHSPHPQQSLEQAILDCVIKSESGPSASTEPPATWAASVLDECVLDRAVRLIAEAVRPRSRNELGHLLGRAIAKIDELLTVEGVGETRAGQLRAFFDRLQDTAEEWEPVLD